MTRKSYVYILSEGALIVFSILLALAVNEWRGRAADAGALKNAVTDMAEELRENREALSATPAYQRAVADELFATADRVRGGELIDKTPFELFLELQSLGEVFVGLEAPLQSVSWQVAKSRGVIAQLDYITAKELAATYDQQLPSVWGLFNQIGDTLARPDMHIAENQAALLMTLGAQFRESASRTDMLIIRIDRSRAALAAEFPALLADQ